MRINTPLFEDTGDMPMKLGSWEVTFRDGSIIKDCYGQYTAHERHRQCAALTKSAAKELEQNGLKATAHALEKRKRWN